MCSFEWTVKYFAKKNLATKECYAGCLCGLNLLMRFLTKGYATFCVGDSDWSPLAELDKPNEQLAAVWALVPPTPPRPSPLPILSSRRQPTTPAQQDVDPDRGIQKGSRFAEYISKKGARLAWKLPEGLQPDHSQQSTTQQHHFEEPSYAARPSYSIHSRL